MRRFGSPQAHSEQVARLALRLFDQLRGRLGLKTEARGWLESAALLHDVGHLIEHEEHHRHSYYLIVNSELYGFKADEIEAIGQIALHHHRKGMPKPGEAGGALLPPEVWKQVKACAALLRLAEGSTGATTARLDVKVRGAAAASCVDLVTRRTTRRSSCGRRAANGSLEKLLGAEVVLTVQKKRGRR
jgi:exopolyphosphatase/guanosine-5'-triphosphate,3'-diphosphate pyrophosphatase